MFQAESNAADVLKKKVGDKLAGEWLTQRQQYRAARVLTSLFRTPDLVDEGGNIAWNEVQRLVDASGRGGFYDDLKLAFGKDGAGSFVDKLHRGEPDIRDKPGKGRNISMFAHPRLTSSPMRLRIHPPAPPIRT